MKSLFYLLSIILFVSCGSETENKVARKLDYEKYLVPQTISTNAKYFELWNNKIKPDSAQLLSFGKVASEYTKSFKKTGDIAYLKKAEQALLKAVEIANIGKAGYRRSLARNYISQHRFKEALSLAQEAEKIGGGLKDTQSLLFDIHMELGNYEIAENYLNKIKNLSDFGCLIRLSKWNDYKGNLNTTIAFMEKARDKAVSSQNRELMLWSYTNLADYYGHDGRINDSYQHYLKALGIDSDNAYAKKGIAWILFSHDRDPEEALRILDSVTDSYKAPDYYLLKAEIAEFMGDDQKRLNNLDAYVVSVNNKAYGDMYNGYNVALFLEETEQYEKAIQIALKEVANRPTPESYSWLGYSYLKNGDKEKAKRIMDTYVYGKTFEPVLCYQAAEVYKANGEMDKVSKLKGDLVDAIYELGPTMEQRINLL